MKNNSYICNRFLPTLRLVCNLRTRLCLVLRILADMSLLFVVIKKNDGILTEEDNG